MITAALWREKYFLKRCCLNTLLPNSTSVTSWTDFVVIVFVDVVVVVVAVVSLLLVVAM